MRSPTWIALLSGILAVGVACAEACDEPLPKEAEPCQDSSADEPRSADEPLPKQAEPDQEICDSGFNGWYWVYQGIAQGQFFKAGGSRLVSLSIRVARLNDGRPAAPLEVEIRDERMKMIYVRGKIAPDESEREFKWISPKIEHNAPLEPGGRYVLLLHSRDTQNRAPWVVNAVYRDVYPGGRHVGYDDDIYFSATYANGSRIRVGPPPGITGIRPINSGCSGGAPWPKALALHFPSPRSEIAARDPVGPVPPGEEVPEKPSGPPPELF